MNGKGGVFNAKKMAGLLGGRRGALFVCLGAAAGIVLIAVSLLSGSGEAAKPPQNTGGYSQSDVNEQVAYLEARLAAIIMKMDGAGGVAVMITLDSSSEYQYAEKESEKSGGSGVSEAQSELMLARGADGGENPVLIREIVPHVRGVAVVCSGVKKNETLRKDIIEMVSALFRIPTTRISVHS